MVTQKRYIFSMALLMVAGTAIQAKRTMRNRPRCSTAQDCLKNRKCQCYCSGIAGYRNKVKEDKPVYITEDKYFDGNGEAVHCFCKQWDIDKFPGPAERD